MYSSQFWFTVLLACITLVFICFENVVLFQTPTIQITHILSTFENNEKHVQDSLYKASWYAFHHGINVEFIDATLEQDSASCPPFAKHVMLHSYFNYTQHLPLVGDYFRAALDNGSGDIIVASNADIAVAEDFYVRAYEWATRDRFTEKEHLNALNAAASLLVYCTGMNQNRLALCKLDAYEMYMQNGGFHQNYILDDVMRLAVPRLTQSLFPAPVNFTYARQFKTNHMFAGTITRWDINNGTALPHPGNDMFVFSRGALQQSNLVNFKHPPGVRPFGYWIPLFMHQQGIPFRRITSIPFVTPMWTSHQGNGKLGGALFKDVADRFNESAMPLLLLALMDDAKPNFIKNWDLAPLECHGNRIGWKDPMFCKNAPQYCWGNLHLACARYHVPSTNETELYVNMCNKLQVWGNPICSVCMQLNGTGICDESIAYDKLLIVI